MKFSLWFFKLLFEIVARVVFVFLPSVLVLIALIIPVFSYPNGKTVIAVAGQGKPKIHELFPSATWNDLEPCGLHFDEQKEFERALQCVNKKVWIDSPLVKEEHTHIPRCFILRASSSDVFNHPDVGFNFLPTFSISPRGVEVGAVVGVYQPETRTVFIVENVDAPDVYRHELQHYFLHMHDPETGGSGHYQEIWHQCEAPYYTPSAKQNPPDTCLPEVEMIAEEQSANI